MSKKKTKQAPSLLSFEALMEERRNNVEAIKTMTERNRKIDSIIESVQALSGSTKPTKSGSSSKPYKPYKNSIPDKILKLMADGVTRTTREVAIALGHTEPTESDISRTSSLLGWLVGKGRILKPDVGKYRLKYAPKPKAVPEKVEEPKMETNIGHDTRIVRITKPVSEVGQ
jgi:hypothetical protein